MGHRSEAIRQFIRLIGVERLRRGWDQPDEIHPYFGSDEEVVVQMVAAAEIGRTAYLSFKLNGVAMACPFEPSSPEGEAYALGWHTESDDLRIAKQALES